MTTTRKEMLEKMAANRAEWLKKQIKAQDELSVPCPDGSWRWADVNNSYGRKTEAELARDREAARSKAAAYRLELEILEESE